MFCRTDAPITHPKQLLGKRVGAQQYCLAVNLWIRGILKEQYGVAPEDLQWVTTKEEGAGFNIPSELSVETLLGWDPEELLLEGEIDVLLSPTVPKRFRQGNPNIRRLFPDCHAEIDDYFRCTGIFPITHTVVMSEALW